jgi:hypothetical protein
LTNQRGTVGLARGPEPHSGDCQFYVNLNDNSALDPNPGALGLCGVRQGRQGMDVVDRIGTQATGAKGRSRRMRRSSRWSSKKSSAWRGPGALSPVIRVATLFISDLHIDASRPAITVAILDFLKARRATADALYILGDLFESWIGDDAIRIRRRCGDRGDARAHRSGVPCFVMHGNRDFLLGERSADERRAAAARSAAVTLYGRVGAGDARRCAVHRRPRLSAPARHRARCRLAAAFLALSVRSGARWRRRARRQPGAHRAVATPSPTSTRQRRDGAAQCRKPRRCCTGTRTARRCIRCRSTAPTARASCSATGTPGQRAALGPSAGVRLLTLPRGGGRPGVKAELLVGARDEFRLERANASMRASSRGRCARRAARQVEYTL